MTGSVGVVTINLPRLALKSKNEKEFFKGLAELMDMAKDSLETKRKVLERLTDANLYMKSNLSATFNCALSSFFMAYN